MAKHGVLIFKENDEYHATCRCTRWKARAKTKDIIHSKVFAHLTRAAERKKKLLSW